MNNQNNPNPAPMPPVDIDMQVRDRNIDALPALQVYTTKVLKPNTHSMQCQHKNILTQEMLCCEDCKYVIKWKYDLNGQTITVPENCILEFDGGSLTNGTIIGQDTVFINVGDATIWGDSLTREGTWIEKGGSSDQIQSDWNEEDTESKAYIRNKPTSFYSDKPYDPDNFSGMGKVYLPKNIVEGENILTQDMFYKDEDETRVPNTNTIFVVMWDFDLNDVSITIPEDSVLLFDGGSMTNGTIDLNGCAVYPSFDPLLDEGLTIEDMPKAGTVKWDTTNGMPLWSNGENWVDATGNVVNE